MTEVLRPETPDAVLEAVAWAVADETPLEILGTGSKRAVGRPAQTAHTLELSALNGITLYEPGELVLSALAGTPMADLERALAENNQMFAFEPVDLGALLGSRDAGAAEGGDEPDAARTAGTLGGHHATNFAGPRRIKDGAVRDHVLGLKAVSGRGESFKSGGRVVKNVTGYDLSRGLAGAWGTLAVATELTFKVLPRPETATTLVLRSLDDGAAIRALSAAMGAPVEASGAAHLPAAIAAEVAALPGGGSAATLVRLEGFGPSVEARAGHLGQALAPFGAAERLDEAATVSLWRSIADVTPFASDASAAVWRISVAPTAGPGIAASVARRHDSRWYFDWAGGLIWLAVPEGDDGAAADLRAAVATAGGGHATLIRGSADLRARIAVFQPQDAALAALSGRLKAQFDPKGILNPGRMTAGR